MKTLKNIKDIEFNTVNMYGEELWKFQNQS